MGVHMSVSGEEVRQVGCCVLREGHGRPCVVCVGGGCLCVRTQAGRDVAHIVLRQVASCLPAEVVGIRACE